MKKIVVTIVSALIVLSACDQQEPVTPNPVDLVLKDIQSNQDVLDQAYAKGGISIAAGDVNGVVGKSESKREFVLKMTELTHDLLIKAIEEGEPNMTGYLKIGDIKGETETSTRLLGLLTSGGEEPLADYYGLLTNELKKVSPATWTIIKNYRDATGKEIPVEHMTLNFEKISAAIKFSDILVSSASDPEQAEEIEELAVKENIPTVLIGLLLPAVQKMHTGETEDSPLEQWLNDATSEVVEGGLDRDIIRRIKAAGYLASLDQVINNRYDNSNQDSASAQILQARFEATMMFAWAEIWEQLQ